MSAKDDIVKEALDAFRLADEADADNRRCALEDIKFARLSEQWPETIRNQRQLEQRPCLTINKLLAVGRQVVNDSRQNRPSIAVHPVDSKADPETANVLSGLIRNIEASSDADIAYDTAVESTVFGGFGYWRVAIDNALNAVDEQSIKSAGVAAFEQDIFIRRIANPFSVYGDPYSQAADSSDWMQAHVVEMLTRDQFKVKYPGAQETDFDGGDWRDIDAPWRDGDNVQVAEYWKREKVVKQALAVQLPDNPLVVMFADEFAKEQAALTAMGAAVIGERAVSSFKVCQYMVSGCEQLSKTEWAGAYIPIIPVYGDEVNVEGKRHFRSLIRDAKDAQRMFNYWRSTATEVVALAPRVPYIGPKGAFETDHAKWSTANSQSHAFLEYDGGIPPERQGNMSVPTGIMQEAMQAADDIKAITGIYDASLGARSNETSGVAIRTRQMEGDVSTFHFIDNLTRAIRHSGRVIIDLIPKVYSTERMVRILGEDGTPEARQINAAGADGIVAHDVRIGRYDLTVTAGPSFTTRREEAAAQMMELVRSMPEAAQLIGDLIAKNLDWPGADEIAKRLKAALPPQFQDEQGQLPPEVQQQLEQMAQALQQLQGALAEASDKKDLEARKIAVDEYRAETERMQAMAPAFDPAQAQALVIQTLRDILEGQDLPQAEDASMMPSPFGQQDIEQAA